MAFTLHAVMAKAADLVYSKAREELGGVASCRVQESVTTVCLNLSAAAAGLQACCACKETLLQDTYRCDARHRCTLTPWDPVSQFG